ncbi:MAG TPA: 2-amino-4-hydroxy-6-hydroxymethyldihydropteridine diphosphokinase [Prolixibacteraceae bacterium]|nr:2-amino-4-hydroxy-6-hydroxymethyldihydropteridine diphosphokinase [Prolixibacteraceae bacterium]
MEEVFLSLGTNMGDKLKNLSAAIHAIEAEIGQVSVVSGIYETEAWGFSCEEHFLNQVIVIQTSMDPGQLIEKCLFIEKGMGRIRSGSGDYESRIIDIDILFFGNQIIEQESLQIPHPLLHLRRFILEPLCEIAPELIHPVFGKPLSELLSTCEDQGIVHLMNWQ